MTDRWLGKPNPLAGFGRVGCGVFIGGQGADGHRDRNISGFGAECKQQKIYMGESVWSDRKRAGIFGLVEFGQKKEGRLCGKVDLLLRRKEIRVVLLSSGKSNKRASGSFFDLFWVFVVFMGYWEDGRRNEKAGGVQKIERAWRGLKGCLLVLCSYFGWLYGCKFFCTSAERVFCWGALENALRVFGWEGDLVKEGTKNYTRPE